MHTYATKKCNHEQLSHSAVRVFRGEVVSYIRLAKIYPMACPRASLRLYCSRLCKKVTRSPSPGHELSRSLLQQKTVLVNTAKLPDIHDALLYIGSAQNGGLVDGVLFSHLPRVR